MKDKEIQNQKYLIKELFLSKEKDQEMLEEDKENPDEAAQRKSKEKETFKLVSEN
jgi:hypothetical protein